MTCLINNSKIVYRSFYSFNDKHIVGGDAVNHIQKVFIPIFQNASLEIFDFDIHEKLELNIRDRTLPLYVISYIKQGTCRLHIDGQDYHAGPGQVVLMPPDTLHDQVKDTNELTIFMWCHFKYQVAGCIDVLKLLDLPRCITIQNPETFEEAFEKYVQVANKPTSISDALFKEARALDIIAHLLDSIIVSSHFEHQPAKVPIPFIQMLNELMSEPNTNLKQLSDKHHMHATYISNQFKKHFGISPIQLKKSMQFGEAKKLLRLNHLSIGEIGQQIGYADPDDFSRFFKRRSGVSPRTYRERFIQTNQL